MKKQVGLVLFFLLTCLPRLHADEWYKEYEKGKKAVEKNNCTEGEKLLSSAIKQNPKPDVRARPYGTFTLEYFPQYYLAICAFQKSNFAEAQKYIDEVEKAGIMSSGSSQEFVVLRNRVRAKLTSPPQ